MSRSPNPHGAARGGIQSNRFYPPGTMLAANSARAARRIGSHSFGDFMEGSYHVGVDGCRAGWIAVTRSRGRLQHALFSTMRELMAAYEDAERILVDIPIGLPWNGVATRPCGRLARSVPGAPRRGGVSAASRGT